MCHLCCVSVSRLQAKEVMDMARAVAAILRYLVLLPAVLDSLSGEVGVLLQKVPRHDQLQRAPGAPDATRKLWLCVRPCQVRFQRFTGLGQKRQRRHWCRLA